MRVSLRCVGAAAGVEQSVTEFDLEVEALIGSVVEVGTRLGVPTPAIEAVYASVKLLDETVRRGGGGIRARE